MIFLRKVADMKKRLEIFNSSDNNVILSIHQNKFTDSKYYGTQIFYSNNSLGFILFSMAFSMLLEGFHAELFPETLRTILKPTA